MTRCIQLAKNGLGSTYPNPLVGSVIVHNEVIIGEGWHYKSGMPHAEVNAIESVLDKTLLPESTIYVSLEPCSHFGKTPPCSDLIISSGIKKVVIGSLDPNPKVAGRGVQKLMSAGCDVVVGVMEADCDQLNKRFFTYHNKKRPYILLKWAQTNDGYIAPVKTERSSEKKPVWITNERSRQLVHKMRAEEQAILVGTQTVIDDNPSLTTRDWEGTTPIRVILDRELKVAKKASVLDGSTKTIVITEKQAEKSRNTEFVRMDFSEDRIKQICDILYNKGIQSILIEGGAKTLQSFIDATLWDEAHVFTGNNSFGRGLKAPLLRIEPFSEEKIKSDRLNIYLNNAL